MSPGDIVMKFSGIVTLHEESKVRMEMSSEGFIFIFGISLFLGVLKG